MADRCEHGYQGYCPTCDATDSPMTCPACGHVQPWAECERGFVLARPRYVCAACGTAFTTMQGIETELGGE